MDSMKQQRGGTFLGLVIGVVVGLVAALIVAVVVTKVPVPFMGRGVAQPGVTEAAEAKKNQDWNPNASLGGKPPARAAAPAAAGPASAASAASGPQRQASAPAQASTSSDPIGDLAKARSSAASADPFIYYVQAGAFRNAADADAQKAKLSLMGVETKVSEREQSGRVVFRVRAGPFETKEEAEKAQERLTGASIEAVLVRVQRS